MNPEHALLDTNIVSCIMKGDELGRIYGRRLKGKTTWIAFVTAGEMYFGAEKRKWGLKKRRRLQLILDGFALIPYDQEIALRYGSVRAEREAQGKPIGFADAWIAACALCYDIPLATHNRRDFEHIPGLDLITEANA